MYRSGKFIGIVLEMRRLTRNDYAAYYPLIREFRDTVFSEQEFQEYMDSLPQTMELWVIEEGDALVGTVTIIFEPKLIFNRCTFAHIEDVCVAKTHRSKGVGSIMIRKVLELPRVRQCRKVTLCCSEAVSKFYIHNGFEPRGIQCSLLINE
jgi:predicted GNAT family N-acyltransferase